MYITTPPRLITRNTGYQPLSQALKGRNIIPPGYEYGASSGLFTGLSPERAKHNLDINHLP